ncbi:MAG TPA: hypothetical protein VLT36_08300 [Candidatus Dormibacteraeota bacterium]|nr:hypothetical protein [Candidatus Dormibacteraeota bacterium]
MRFLSVAERELRAGARQKSTYRVRAITAAVFFLLLAWLMWVFDGFRAPQIFGIFSTITFFYCLIIGTTQAADCLSAEKREGTLGLLFLTNLNGPEIIGGKLCSGAMAAAYGLFAIVPLLALQMLVGGITLGYFWRTVLAFADAIFFSVATAFLASSLCVRQFTAVATAGGVALFFSAGLMAIAAMLDVLKTTKTPNLWIDAIGTCSPLYTLLSAETGAVWRRNRFWWSVLAVNAISWLFIALATWRISVCWKDSAASPGWTKLRVLQRWRQLGRNGRIAMRRRLLSINPMFWLGGRARVSAPFFMFLVLLIAAITCYVAAPYFSHAFRVGGTANPMLGQLMAWLWAGLLIHALVLYYAAMVASRRLAEDKETGALELVLSTPTSERSIRRGLWLAYARKMFFPATIAILVHFFFIWLGATLFILEPEIRLPRGLNAAELLWRTFWNEPIAGVRIEWGLVLALRAVLLVLVLLMITWVTVGSLGRWLGLKMKHPGFAPMLSVALIVIPPIIGFTALCYLVDKTHLDRLPERIFIPLMVWAGFATGAGPCAVLSFWSARRFRKEFRTTVTSRFQPKPVRHWGRTIWRYTFRFTVGIAALGVLLAVVLLCFYGYQNWRSRKAWAAFENSLRARHESLTVTPLLPRAVPADQNFALSPAFLKLLNPEKGHPSVKALVNRVQQFQPALAPYIPSATTALWPTQGFAPLQLYLKALAPDVKLAGKSARERAAEVLVQSFQPYDAELRSLAEAARLPCFQTSTNLNAMAVLYYSTNEHNALEQLEIVYEARACALLAVKRPGKAAEDTLTTVDLARLVRQTPNAVSSTRAQTMLVRSLQPLWEGIVSHQWDEPQLAKFQAALAQFNLVVDHTNAIRRVVLANIEIWRGLAENHNVALPPAAQQRYGDPELFNMQPRAWWFDNCIQLYEAGQTVLTGIDVANAHVPQPAAWLDINGLPLDDETTMLLQQSNWPGPSPWIVSFAQTSVNQGIIACALERFRISHSNYPEQLDELNLEFLGVIPNDLIRGRPMLYQKIETNRFILRSVGPNGIDDRKSKTSDDWLWSFPTSAPSTVKTNKVTSR